MPSIRSRLLLVLIVLFACACGSAQLTEGLPEPGFAPDHASVSAAVAARTDVLTDPGELPQLLVASDAGKPLPLQRTGVKAMLAGFTADVEVAQTYSNPYDKVIEASYVFPLPENAAVYSMKMVIGARVIEAVVKERGEARRVYERARSEGHTAALLEQERPNVFTQSVANIEPGKKIDVVIRYVQDLSYDAGEYEFVFPMVVGPRYIPGAPLGGAQSGTGTHADTVAVPDASRITPAVLGKGERSGHDISLEVTASVSGAAISSFSVPTHDVVTEPREGGLLHVKLSDKEKIANRDFVLRYRVAGEKPRAVLYAAGKNDGFFSLVVQPPALDVESLVGRRELVFVVDVSGSMSGTPLSMCKQAMRDALAKMRPVDTFNVITFAGSTGKLFKQPRPANDAAIREAVAYVERLSAGGGTEMLDAISAALTPDVEKGRHRYVFFLTDGFVGNEDQILSATKTFVSTIEDKGQRARVFGFGTGSSVNRMLLDGLGRYGRGLTVYATNREDPERAVNRFYRYIDRSVLRDVKIDFGSLKTKEVFPVELPDLFASHPMIVHGKFSGSLAGSVVVHATGADGSVEIPVTLARAPMDDGWPLQGLLWARSKIGWLERDLWEDGPNEGAQQKITELGISHHLVTQFTSFVAVDTATKVGDGNPVHVDQPVEAPEDVDAVMAGARVMTLSGVPGTADGYDYQFQDDVLAQKNQMDQSVVSARVQPVMMKARSSQSVSGQMYAVQQVSRGPRGCNCDLREQSAAEGEWAVVSFALALAAVVARKRKPRLSV